MIRDGEIGWFVNSESDRERVWHRRDPLGNVLEYDIEVFDAMPAIPPSPYPPAYERWAREAEELEGRLREIESERDEVFEKLMLTTRVHWPTTSLFSSLAYYTLAGIMFVMLVIGFLLGRIT